MITLGKRGDLHARRRALRVIRSREVTAKVFDELAERYPRPARAATRGSSSCGNRRRRRGADVDHRAGRAGAPAAQAKPTKKAAPQEDAKAAEKAEPAKKTAPKKAGRRRPQPKKADREEGRPKKTAVEEDDRQEDRPRRRRPAKKKTRQTTTLRLRSEAAHAEPPGSVVWIALGCRRGGGSSPSSRAPATLRSGRAAAAPAPDFTLPSGWTDGAPVALSDLRGQVVLRQLLGDLVQALRGRDAGDGAPLPRAAAPRASSSWRSRWIDDAGRRSGASASGSACASPSCSTPSKQVAPRLSDLSLSRVAPGRPRRHGVGALRRPAGVGRRRPTWSGSDALLDARAAP